MNKTPFLSGQSSNSAALCFMSWVKDGDIMIYIQSTVRSLYLNLNQSKPFLRHMLALFCRRLGSDIYIYTYIYKSSDIHNYTYLCFYLHVSSYYPDLQIIHRYILYYIYTIIHCLCFQYVSILFPLTPRLTSTYRAIALDALDFCR